jgi:dienelactone hydrolase
MADRVAATGALVILADLLGPAASLPNSNVRTDGQTLPNKAAGYWVVKHWPLVKKRKLEYMEWFGAGPGSWLQQRPRLLQLLEEMQQQGLYDKDAATPAAIASSSADSSSSSGEAAEASSSSSSSTGRPLGVLGLGWGTYIGLRAAGDDECIAAGINAVAAMSPVTFQKDYDLATALKLPVALLPAKYDPMEQAMLTIDLLQRPYAQRCIFKRYGKVRDCTDDDCGVHRCCICCANELLMSC